MDSDSTSGSVYDGVDDFTHFPVGASVSGSDD
jgi:hypothetical protein